jgi:FAD-dependent urate hydroxylase
MTGERRIAPVVIIGAGPYGLATAAHLRGLGVAVRVFGRTMSSWVEHMPVGMFLKSAPRASSISDPQSGSTLADYLSTIGHRPMTDADAVPLDLFVEYGKWFQQRNVPEVEQSSVSRVSRSNHGFEIELSSGETFQARAVVVATGHVAFAHVPRELLAALPTGPSPTGPISHASQWSDFRPAAGRRVLVVGSGQSALESAVLLGESGAHATLVARSSRLIWPAVPRVGDRSWLRAALKPHSDLGPGWSLRVLADAPQLVRLLPDQARRWLLENILGPSGGFWLRDRFESTVAPMLGRKIVSFEPTAAGGVRVELSHNGGEPEVLEADHLVAGTGYRVDLDRMDFLDPQLRSAVRRVGGGPRLDPSMRSSVPGLYFVGLAAAPTFGPYLRFVAGTRFAAPRVATAIAART